MGLMRDLIRRRPFDAGELCPPLSLTADDGTWIKLRDFQGHLNVLLVFYRSPSDRTEAYLKDIEAHRAQLEGLDTAVFGVHTSRTDRLRGVRSRMGLGFSLVYDPLALSARSFGLGRSGTPFVRDGVYLIDKDNRVLLAQRGHPPAGELVQALAQAQGVEAPQAAVDTNEVQAIDATRAEALLDQPDSKYRLVDVRTLSEFEADHSPDATRIPVDDLPHRYRELKQTSNLIFVCQAGDRAAAAAEFISSIGGNEIYAVIGGMSSWTGRRTRGDARSGVSGGE